MYVGGLAICSGRVGFTRGYNIGGSGVYVGGGWGLCRGWAICRGKMGCT